MEKHDLQVSASEDVDGSWMIYAAVPGKDALVMARCRERRNIARTARQEASQALNIPESRLKITGVNYK